MLLRLTLDWLQQYLTVRIKSSHPTEEHVGVLLEEGKKTLRVDWCKYMHCWMSKVVNTPRRMVENRLILLTSALLDFEIYCVFTTCTIWSAQVGMTR